MYSSRGDGSRVDRKRILSTYIRKGPSALISPRVAGAQHHCRPDSHLLSRLRIHCRQVLHERLSACPLISCHSAQCGSGFASKRVIKRVIKCDGVSLSAWHEECAQLGFHSAYSNRSALLGHGLPTTKASPAVQRSIQDI